MGILFVNPAGKTRVKYTHPRKPGKKAKPAKRNAPTSAAPAKAKAKARLLKLRSSLAKLRGNPAVITSSPKGKPMRKFKFKLRRNPTPASKRLPADQLKKMAKSQEIMRKHELALARKKRAAAARKAAKAAPYKAAGKKSSAKKAPTRRKKMTAAQRLEKRKSRWVVKSRKQLREATAQWKKASSWGGQVHAGNLHYPYLIKNPGGKRRRTSRKLRKNPARRNRRMRLRRNPSVASIESALLAVIPTIGGFMVARMVSKKVSPMIPGLSAAGKYGETAVALAMLVGADFATDKVTVLSKYKTGIVAGFALNAVESALRTFLPESIKSQIGLSDYVQLSGGMYDRGAVGDYVQIDNGVGEYVVMPDDDSLGYVDVQQDLAGDVYEDLAGTRMDLAGLRAPIPTHRRIGGVPAMSYQAEVPDAQIEDESALYEGMFSGR